MTSTRKTRERRPPGAYLRSRSGNTPARLVRTGRTRNDLWLYRLRYGPGLVGNQEWTLDELEAAGVKFLSRRPSDLDLTGSDEEEMETEESEGAE